MKRQMNYA